MLGCKKLTTGAVTRAHEHRSRSLYWFGFRVSPWRLEIGPVIIKFTFPRPQLFTERYPVFSDIVPFVMFELRGTKHGNFPLIPTGNNVQAKSAAGYVINSGDFFGGAYGVYSGYVDGRKNPDAFSDCS